MGSLWKLLQIIQAKRKQISYFYNISSSFFLSFIEKKIPFSFVPFHPKTTWCCHKNLKKLHIVYSTIYSCVCVCACSVSVMQTLCVQYVYRSQNHYLFVKYFFMWWIKFIFTLNGNCLVYRTESKQMKTKTPKLCFPWNWTICGK